MKLDINNCKPQVSVSCLPIANHKSVYRAFQCKAGSEAACKCAKLDIVIQPGCSRILYAS